MIIMVYGVAFFRPLGWGEILWVVVLFLLIALVKLLELDARTR